MDIDNETRNVRITITSFKIMSQDLTDVALAEKLRREDPEQFHTLVRMHLSFVLDLQTDEYVMLLNFVTSY